MFLLPLAHFSSIAPVLATFSAKMMLRDDEDKDFYTERESEVEEAYYKACLDDDPGGTNNLRNWPEEIKDKYPESDV